MLTDAHGTRYEPWEDDGLVGYRVTDKRGRVSYLYLSPSDEDSDGRSNVFLYRGGAGDPGLDAPLTWVYAIQESEDEE